MNSLFLRRRGVWEAADSGLLLWRNGFVHFLPFFAVPVWVTACGLRLLPGKFFLLSYIILWWLKPLFDRLVLHVVSLRFFVDEEVSHAPSQSRDLRRGLFGTIRRGLLGDLLWRRFSPNRAAYMPVRVLEHLDRKQFGPRKKTLSAGGLGFCSFISGLGLGMEVMLLVGEALFVTIITQMFFPGAFTYMRYNPDALEIFIFAAFCFNYILVESLYVCMGFGLYINSRVEVEGWDLQLVFQKFAGAEKSGINAGIFGTNVKAVIFVCLFLARIFGPASQAVYAEEQVEYFPGDFPVAAAEALENLREITASADFGYTRDGWEIRFKKSPDDAWEMPDMELAPWAEKIRRIFSVMLKFLVILAAAGSLGLALFWLRKYRANSFRRNLFRDGEKDYVNPLLSAESPESLFARSSDLYNKGCLREAWAACLAGCIGACSRYRSVSFPVDATEYGCLDLVRAALPEAEKDFGELVRSWVLFAYGGRTPSREAFERALAYGRSIGTDDVSIKASMTNSSLEAGGISGEP